VSLLPEFVLPYLLDVKLPFARTGRIWPYYGDPDHPVILYDYTATRERAGPEKFQEGYRGYLQADAYGGYDAFFKDPTRYCEDGDLAIDNYATERAIRSVAVGRNNCVFFGSAEGGKTAAVLRSFVASCERAGVDPFAWLKDILYRIATHPITRLAELLPHNWAPAQA
jgi:hypothetical protein